MSRIAGVEGFETDSLRNVCHDGTGFPDEFRYFVPDERQCGDRFRKETVPEENFSSPRQNAGAMEIGKILPIDKVRAGKKVISIRGGYEMTDNEIIERNRAVMRRFEKCINTNDLALGEELISAAAAFTAPFSPVPLYGAKGYLSVVDFMRRSFPDVHWTLENMVADKKTIAVQWRCTGTFSGTASFAGLQPNNRKFSTTVMNFYTFDEEGKIIDDVTAVGIAGILQGIGVLPSIC
ncbi:MAG: ester cyclase [Lentisphaeria bacterium]|nr:MAG: ester cyclase [Lentisphaeria bacterium]